jgi:hypothetical protein
MWPSRTFIAFWAVLAWYHSFFPEKEKEEKVKISLYVESKT